MKATITEIRENSEMFEISFVMKEGQKNVLVGKIQAVRDSSIFHQISSEAFIDKQIEINLANPEMEYKL